jgi:DNA-binding FrmR family transcriptional regulator
MLESRRDPSPNELLKRIVQLEGKLAAVQRQLKSDVPSMKAQVADLLEAFKYQVDATTNNIIEIHDLLWPLVRKVFPGFMRTKKQIDAIMLPAPTERKDRQQ